MSRTTQPRARSAAARGRSSGWFVGVSFCLLALGGLLACQSSVGPDETGRFTVLLTDAPFPFDLVKEANVTIGRVDVVTDAEVATILEEERTFNLLDLRDGVTAVLAEEELPAGSIAQIRLIVTDAEVVLDDASMTTFDLFIPSGAQSGLKIVLGAFVDAGAETIVTLDFDVEDSFIVQGNPNTPAGIRGFLFKPVVRVADVTTTTTSAAVGDEEEEQEEDENGDEENGNGGGNGS